jgi:hypothetical protein
MIKSHVLYQLSYGLACRTNILGPPAFSSLAQVARGTLHEALDAVRI